MTKQTKNPSSPQDLTHFDQKGQVHMVDVGEKAITARRAVAEGIITMLPTTLQKIQAGDHKKGDVIGIARIAAIMAAKKTAELVPLCHPIMLTKVGVEFEIEAELSAVRCTVTCETRERTGIEMEALTAVQVGLLTIYDMCKAVDRDMHMTDIHLLSKSGGRSGDWQSPT